MVNQISLIMSRTIPFTTRLKIVRQRSSGKKLTAIAEDLGQSYSGVCRIWRQYQLHGEPGLRPSYNNCGKEGPAREGLAYRAACWLKFLHREWGGGFIKQKLEQRYPDRKAPHERTLQRWFRGRGLDRVRYRSVPPPKKGRAKKVFEVIQLDAKEQFRIKSGGLPAI